MKPDAERTGTDHRTALNRRLRLAFLASAEERSSEVFGRALSEDELRRVARRYPGDMGE